MDGAMTRQLLAALAALLIASSTVAAQTGSGVQLGGAAQLGYVPVATGANGATWSNVFTAPAMGFAGVPFPTVTATTNFGSTSNRWATAYLGGVTLGIDQPLPGYIIGSRTQDLALSSISDGSTCHEIDFATPGGTAAGFINLVQRFNMRSLCVAQGLSIINTFESITFPFATTFPLNDAFSPGFGHTAGATTAVVTGTIPGTTVLTVTGVTSGTIGLGNYITDPNHLTGTGIYITSFGTGAGGIGTYNLSAAASFPSGTLTITTPPYLQLQGGLNGGAYLASGFFGIGGIPTNPLTIFADGSTGGVSQFLIKGATNPNKQFLYGYDSAGNFGYLQAVFQGTGFEPIVFNPLGGSIVSGKAVATNATTGFLYIGSGAGTPTGVPVTQTGTVPMYIDTTNNQLWLYLGGAWKQPKTPAGAALVTWQ